MVVGGNLSTEAGSSCCSEKRCGDSWTRLLRLLQLQLHPGLLGRGRKIEVQHKGRAALGLAIEDD